ncbi:hypothetical protein [Roseisolibacter sp. H3M3-2]|uniref:hypothetical protein n=1 Tax=Roseisolibacter sp. H3M3-2 TaxID=3031323 RepID=UPI0023DABD6F|nr:hypothetical protein [Roseisolibacter sp. H3M3-2]MDF1504256.1 hypothetical protein [Roseisolibacter sp. H3M3-2]
MRLFRPSLAALLVLACGAADAGVGPLPPGGHHVLFVGNSLTYVNDLPRTLADLAAAGGDTVRTAAVARPDFALVDHAAGLSDAVPAIRRGGWAYVVMQQGPSSRGVNRDTLVLGARALATAIREAGARPALYMVWPARANAGDFDAVRESYRAAACAVDGVFAPAGEAWRVAWRDDPSLALWGADGFHPSPLGTWLAALVLYERVTGRDARALPAEVRVAGTRVPVPEATARLLQRAAHEANTTWVGCPMGSGSGPG